MDMIGSGSLNEGVELDNEVIDPHAEQGKILDEVLFKEIIPGEVPELADVEIDALVTKLRDLEYAHVGLANQGGISQQIALENHHLVPGLITDACPVEFYTREVTKTRYGFALEAIDQEKQIVNGKIGKLLTEYPKLAEKHQLDVSKFVQAA